MGGSGPRTRCVVVFARTPPVEARAKGMPAAARLFACARARVLAAAAASGADVLLSAPDLVGSPPGGTVALPQRGRTFEERLRSAFADARALGYSEIVVVPGDVPGLRADHLREALRRLRACPTVLGPSPDGGVYLLGVRGEYEGVLAGVPWRSRRVHARLLANAPGAAVFPPLADLDGHAHLRALRAEARLDAELALLVAALLARSASSPALTCALPLDPHRSPDACRPPPSLAA